MDLSNPKLKRSVKIEMSRGSMVRLNEYKYSPILKPIKLRLQRLDERNQKEGRRGN